MSTELLNVEPGELRFPFELGQQVTCKLKLQNVSDLPVVFKMKTTAPKKYCVRPNTGCVSPQGSAEIFVTMQAQLDPPTDMLCKDKFLLQYVSVPEVISTISPDVFSGKEIFDTKLRVVYYPLGHTPMGNNRTTFTTADLKAKIQEVNATIASLAEERRAAVHLSERLKEELSKMPSTSAKELSKPRVGFSLLIVFLVGLLGVLIGHMFTS